MDCDRAERLLPLLGRGDLKPKDARALQEHLLDCSRCGESVHDYAQFFDLLHSTAELDFDEEFFGRIRRSVLSEIRLRERRLPTPVQLWRSNPATVLGVVVLVIALGAGIARRGHAAGRFGKCAEHGRVLPVDGELASVWNFCQQDSSSA